MDEKQALKYLSLYLYHLMQEGVEAEDTKQRLFEDVGKIMEDPILMMETIKEYKYESKP